MTSEQLVNEAITGHLSALYILNDLRSLYSKEVVELVDEIASFATNQVVRFSEDDIVNHQATKDALAVEFPFLTESSKIKIADVAAYFWK